MSMDQKGYESLARVLQAAYDQAAKGKGAERHATGLPFDQQPMQTGSDLLGTDAGLAFQAIKKIREGSSFTEYDRFERELLGAINYIAGMIIWRQRARGLHVEQQTTPVNTQTQPLPVNQPGTSAKHTDPWKLVGTPRATEPVAKLADDPWYGAPDWAKWKAQDDTGAWWWYDEKPEQLKTCWASVGAEAESVAGQVFPNPNWRDTLISR